ncbi:FecR family protein [Pedobacter sp. AW31-3R]|uniref:FecR family protein n=1 Tax=Pedobacter sp. AW31-3R TaxID=3445781 RepID=UPI003F9F03EB
MNKKEAEQLFEKYLAGNCTPEELGIIKRAYNKEIPGDMKEISEKRYSEMKVNMWSRLKQAHDSYVTTYSFWPKIAIAAVLLITTGAGLYFFTLKKEEVDKNNMSVYANKIPAEKNTVVLTLANGKRINLSDAKSGVVIKTSELTYDDGTPIENINSKGSDITTISTPRGGQYNIELSDGTKVVLNAASMLKFPSRFAGLINRTVELSGEGYFQVAKDKKYPFIVKSGNQEVKVLGTHFNINCYPDEDIMKTTLVEGSVEIRPLSGTFSSKKLVPGQQAELSKGGIEISIVDTESALAWKDGDFIFNDDITTIMRQISRWYDVEVVYQGKVSAKEFVGTFSKSKDISEILKALELTNRVHFKIEGRRIIVMP